jgi:hypothetical protein
MLQWVLVASSGKGMAFPSLIASLYDMPSDGHILILVHVSEYCQGTTRSLWDFVADCETLAGVFVPTALGAALVLALALEWASSLRSNPILLTILESIEI